MTLFPLFCLSSLNLSPLSLISRPCLSSLSLHCRTQQPQPSTISRSSLVSVSHPCLFNAESSTRNLAPYHAIYNSHLQPSTTEHSPRIRDSQIRDPRPTIQHGKTNSAKPTRRARWNQHGNPRPTIHNRSNASTSSSWSEWSFGFYWSRVVKFRIFCLWILLIDAFLVDLWSFRCLSWWVIVGLFHHLAGNEGSGRSYKSERAENEREERDGIEDIILRYIILLCRYIILMSKRGK